MAAGRRSASLDLAECRLSLPRAHSTGRDLGVEPVVPDDDAHVDGELRDLPRERVVPGREDQRSEVAPPPARRRGQPRSGARPLRSGPISTHLDRSRPNPPAHSTLRARAHTHVGGRAGGTRLLSAALGCSRLLPAALGQSRADFSPAPVDPAAARGDEAGVPRPRVLLTPPPHRLAEPARRGGRAGGAEGWVGGGSSSREGAVELASQSRGGSAAPPLPETRSLRGPRGQLSHQSSHQSPHPSSHDCLAGGGGREAEGRV